jgi:nitrite reductase (NADH) small subunit
LNAERSWVRITDCKNIPLREGRAIRLGNHEIAIFNLGNRFLAIENRCPHQGGPLSDGIVSGSRVVCPLHAWKVDLEDGTVERPAGATPNCVETFATRIENGTVLIEVPRAHGVTCINEDVTALCLNEQSRLDRKELST